MANSGVFFAEHCKRNAHVAVMGDLIFELKKDSQALCSKELTAKIVDDMAQVRTMTLEVVLIWTDLDESSNGKQANNRVGRRGNVYPIRGTLRDASHDDQVSNGCC